MIKYPYQTYTPVPLNDDRYFFVPFLTGALVGGAAVGLTRPRPIVNNNPTNTGFNQPYNPQMPYGNYSYSYYYPYPRPY